MKDKLKDHIRTEDRPLVETGPIDAEGARFDPEFHVADKKTGEPVMNKDGSFRKRPRQPIDTIELPGESYPDDPDPSELI